MMIMTIFNIDGDKINLEYKMNQEEINKKQDELRKLRNKYSEKMLQCQKEIDNLEIDKYNANQYLNKWVKIKCEPMRKFINSQYFKVNRIDRLISGPKMYGTLITINKYYDDSPRMYEVDYEACIQHIKWENLNKDISIIEDINEIRKILMDCMKETFDIL